MNKQHRDVRTLFASRGSSEVHSFGKILTISEVAQILRMHRNTVYRLVKRGDLPGFKIGDNWRVDEKALRTLLARESDRKVLSPKS
jgi:excisionase family DNA binding protein